MMDEEYVPHTFWGEATQATVYLPNRTPLRPNNDKTPYELWKVLPTSVKHYKVFGRKCFTKNNDKNLGRFDSRADDGIFLENSAQSKGYSCYNKIKKVFEDYIDIVVDEIMTKSKSSKGNSNSYGEESSTTRLSDQV